MLIFHLLSLLPEILTFLRYFYRSNCGRAISKIDLDRNLMVQGLVGINEARAGSPRGNVSHRK